MQQNYSIETLFSTFLRHAEMVDENNKLQMDHYKKNYPDSPVPEHFLDAFNIARALSVIANEIQKLRIRCEEIENNC